MSMGVGGCLSAVGAVRLGEDMADVREDGAEANNQRVGDRLITLDGGLQVLEQDGEFSLPSDQRRLRVAGQACRLLSR
jgi:hypothetical protein